MPSQKEYMLSRSIDRGKRSEEIDKYAFQAQYITPDNKKAGIQKAK